MVGAKLRAAASLPRSINPNPLALLLPSTSLHLHSLCPCICRAEPGRVEPNLLYLLHLVKTFWHLSPSLVLGQRHFQCVGNTTLQCRPCFSQLQAVPTPGRGSTNQNRINLSRRKELDICSSPSLQLWPPPCCHMLWCLFFVHWAPLITPCQLEAGYRGFKESHGLGTLRVELALSPVWDHSYCMANTITLRSRSYAVVI